MGGLEEQRPYVVIRGDGEFYREIGEERNVALRMRWMNLVREQVGLRQQADMQEEELHGMRQREVHELLAMFAVFQGVIFTGVAQSTTLGCSDVVTPILLSVTSTAATLVAVLHKQAHARALEHEARINKLRADAVAGLIEDMKLHPRNFDLDRDAQRTTLILHPSRTPFDRLRHICTSADGWTLTLLIISAIIIASCKLLLCSPHCDCRRKSSPSSKPNRG